jgi:tRNA pseudouridine55 synthase
MQYKRTKRRVDGVLLLDKPPGLSSNQALQQVKRLYQAAKAGHTGSLDPLATGLLPICFGEATKFSHFLLDADKSYQATIKLGQNTTTGDAEGEVLTSSPVNVSEPQLRKTLLNFTGEIMQVPPMYSALKHQGKALYEYAREGVEIERKARQVSIFSITLESFDAELVVMKVHCSKGTYIRTLAEDIGNALGCGGHLRGLRRLTTAHFSLGQALTMEALDAMAADVRDRALRAVDATIENLASVTISTEAAYYFKQGQAIWQAGVSLHGYFRVYDKDQLFLGLAEQAADGKIAPKRLIVH